MLRALRRTAAVFAVYLVLAGCLTWPLAAHLTTHLPATFPGSAFDPLYSGWALAWESHVLAHGSLNIANANIYYPARDALFYGPVVLGALPYFAPTYLSTGNPTLALNLLLLGSIALTAATIHLVIYAWTGLHAAGLVGAAAFLANRWLLYTFIPTVPHLSVLFYLPLIVMLSARAVLSLRGALLLFGLVVAQCLTDVSYVTPAVLAPMGTLAVLRALRPATKRSGVQLLLITLAAALVIFVVHSPYLAIAARNPQLAQQTNWRLDAPRGPLELPTGLMNALSPLAIPSLSVVLLAAGGLSAWRRWRGSAAEASAARHTLLWIAVGVAISLPLRVSLLGHAFSLPHLLLAQRWGGPLTNALRLPERLRVAALIGTVLLIGLLFAQLLRHLGLANSRRPLGNLLAALVALVLYAQYATAIGQPQSYGPRLPVWYALQRPPGDSPALQELRAIGGPTFEAPLPRLRPMTAAAHAPAMYRSIFHWQPLLNGYSSYWPEGFAERMRTAARLPDATTLRALRQQTGLEFIIARIDEEVPIDASLAEERAAWLELAKRGGRPDLRLVAADDVVALFRVTDEVVSDTHDNR